MITVEINMHLCSMRLINVDAFLEREQLFRREERVDRRAKVLEFGDDEVAEYAILSHRWTEQEVDYNEIAKLAKMDEEERTEIRHRGGYRKILQSCEQAEKDGYKWVVGRHMLYRQAKQRRAIRGHQLHVLVVRKLKDMLCVPPRPPQFIISHCG